MSATRVVAVFLPALLAASGGLAQSRPTPPSSDARAIEVAGRVMQALGGETAWNNTHFIRFTFAVDREGKTLVSRTHSWDKWTGRYRLDGQDREGKPYVVLMNLNTKEGKAQQAGQPLAGAVLEKQLQDAYATWVNDTYWLLMPYKMMDPGVVLAYDGESKQGGAACDKVRLSFQNVGLTPRDQYWVYVNRKTGLVDRWDYVLKGAKKAPTSFVWDGWQKHGNVMLAPERRNMKDDTRIHFPLLEVPASVPDATFSEF
jgi:hypothetical protein